MSYRQHSMTSVGVFDRCTDYSMRYCLALLYLLVVTGISSYDNINHFNASFVFELCVIGFFLLNINRFYLRIVFPVFLISSYLIVSMLFVLYSAPEFLVDYFQAYKVFFYIIVFFVCLGKLEVSIFDLRLFYRVLIFAFLIKYIAARFISEGNISFRPGLFTENNFELVFLCLIYFAVSEKYRLSLVWNILLGVVGILSGSLSGLAVIGASIYFVNVKKISTASVGYSFLALLMILSLLSVFYERYTGRFEIVDRYQFLQIFLMELNDWGVLEYIFGTLPITPLSNESCNALSFYSALFSLSGSDDCFSVILHSFVLRAIFDHGFLGLFLIFYALVHIMKNRGFGLRYQLGVISVTLLNGLSVSSVNSSFYAVGFLILIASKK